jgi:hypothetical protein
LPAEDGVGLFADRTRSVVLKPVLFSQSAVGRRKLVIASTRFEMKAEDLQNRSMEPVGDVRGATVRSLATDD